MNQQPLIPSAINPQATPETDLAAQGKQRIALVETVEWLDRLTANSDFARYLAFVNSGAAAMRQQGENLSNDMERRDAFSQRHFILIAMSEWPAKELAAARNQLKALDEKQKPRG